MANQSKSGIIPILVALVCTAVFIGWLATRERPEAVAVTEPTEEPTEAPVANAPATPVEADSMTRTGFVRDLQGQVIELSSVPVSMQMGSNFFWIDLPNGQSFLVKMDSAMIASGATPPAGGSTVTVEGLVAAKDNALLDQWRQAGVLESDDHRLQAEFGSSYIEARRVRPAGN